MGTMGILAVILLCMSLFQGRRVESVLYDSSASLQCVDNPMEPLYNGGIIENSQFNDGLTGWSVPWGVTTAVNTSHSGNKFAVSRSNSSTKLSRSVFQKFQMQSDHHYALSAWFQVPNRSAEVVVRAVVKGPSGNFTVAGGVLVSQPGCWTMLKGGVTADASGPAELSFEADEDVDIMVDNVSLQPFSPEEWGAQRNHSAARTRQSSVEIVVAQQAIDGKKQPLANATVRIALTRPGFPFGSAMSAEILRVPAYEAWFMSRFTVTTFENEMKWYSTEPSPGREDYRVPDAMLRLAEAHGVRVRGHNVFWDSADVQMSWVKPLSPDQLKAAAWRHARSVVSRYAGRLISWDVVNENLHYDFFESRLGANASSEMYREVGRLDGAGPAPALLFMNEFGTLEQPLDMKVLPTKYAAKMEQIRAYAGNGGLRLAVGLEAHFGARPNIPYMRAVLDALSELDVPIWLTELDVAPSSAQAQARYLEEVLREAYAHPAVHGIVMWAAWHAKGCYVMCLTDNDFRNLPVGDVVDKIIAEWRTHTEAATTDVRGVARADLVHGDYNITVTHPSLKEPVVHAVTVNASSVEPINIKV